MMMRLTIKSIVLSLLVVLAGCASSGVARTPNDNTSADAKAAAINMELGLNYMQRGDYKVALDKLQRSLEQNPNLPSTHNTIGVLYQRLGEMDKAESISKKLFHAPLITLKHKIIMVCFYANKNVIKKLNNDF